MTLFPSLLRNQNLCILLARYPEWLLSRASSQKAGHGLHGARPRSPPAPVELGLAGTEGAFPPSLHDRKTMYNVCVCVCVCAKESVRICSNCEIQ